MTLRQSEDPFQVAPSGLCQCPIPPFCSVGWPTVLALLRFCRLYEGCACFLPGGRNYLPLGGLSGQGLVLMEGQVHPLVPQMRRGGKGALQLHLAASECLGSEPGRRVTETPTVQS